MLNQNGINNDQSQNVLKEGAQFQDQTITYLNKNQNDTNEITNTLTDKPLISPEREMDEDEYFEEEVKRSNLVFEEKNT